ncbi:MAG: hypothetical protein H6767_09955 [Candidatus Peribacteria bacterium]|nr:MAG: hypothetical protein H6767_09955 [Candidatus Peribacteria bacterium]
MKFTQLKHLYSNVLAGIYESAANARNIQIVLSDEKGFFKNFTEEL